MLLPPALGSPERRKHDLNNLRIYYMLCEEIGIAGEENVQKSFACLMRWAGDYKFMEEFGVFQEYIDKRKQEITQVNK